MILRLALRSLLAHPVRSIVLACGFGLGVGVMATLLGVGEVILDQARSPALVGGGDVVLASATGQIPAAKWILASGLEGGRLESRVRTASPSRHATLYLVRDGRRVPIRARGGIPSLERALGDPETADVTAWRDTADDRAWVSPDPGEALRSLDRFHPIPDHEGTNREDTKARSAESWAEWLYFNGSAGGNRFYLTFLVGPAQPDGTRAAGVRLQLDRSGVRASYSASANVDAAEVLRTAPDLTIGSNRVRLDGMRYEMTLDLAADAPERGRGAQTGQRVRGTVTLEAVEGRAMPPLAIHGSNGWVSGYVVPVTSGMLGGALSIDGETVRFEGGTGYHDHNWGFWKDVSWRWGQVQYGDLSIVYGRINPPADAADPERIPGFLALLGAGGPLGYAANVRIAETNGATADRPDRTIITARGAALDLTLEFDIESAIVTRGGSAGFLGDRDFFQLRGRYRVRGTAGGRTIDFTAPGSAETFRSR